MTSLSKSFPTYTGFEPSVPVRLVSRPGESAIHRFYDTSPVSPSGRLLALTEFEFEDRLPSPGDEASVVVVNLVSGEEVFRSRTSAWDTQLGAQAQWGSSDDELFFNRMAPDWQPYGVKVDIARKTEFALDGPIYVVSPDGRTALSPDLVRIWLIQPGYGVIVPSSELTEPVGAPDNDGLFATDTLSGTTRLAVSMREIYDAFPDEFRSVDLNRGGFYGFHAKWSPDGRRIMFLVRWKDRLARKGHSRNWIITMRDDFSDLRIALTPERWAGGHHPNWCPDSEHIVMNLVFPTRKALMPKVERLVDRAARKFRIPFYRSPYPLRFAMFRYDGSQMRPISTSHIGSGHPTWHEELQAVLSDAYPWEPVTAGDGTSPIRLVSSRTDTEETIVRVRTMPEFMGSRREWRIDPHPAWSRQLDTIVFNGFAHGKRAVYVADLRSRLASASSRV